MPKYEDYPAKTAPSNNDILLVADSAASNATKRMTRGQFLSGTALPADTVDTQAVDDSAITPAKLLAGTGTSWPWTSWTPSWTNVTIGNATVVARYKQIGKTVNFTIKISWGSSSSASGIMIFSLPVTSVAVSATAGYAPMGLVTLLDAGSTAFLGVLTHNTTGTALINHQITNGNYSVIQATSNIAAPFAFGTGDEILISGSYEAA